MKINTSVLTHFLNRCAVKTHGFGNKGVISMPDLLLVIEGNQMKVEGVSPAGNLQIEFVETLSESVEREEFPIVDSVLFHKVVSNEFSDNEIKMNLDGNNIILKSDKIELDFPTVSEIETMKRYPEARGRIRENGYSKTDFTTTVSLTATELVDAIGKSGDTYSYVYEFIVEKGVFKIRIRTEDKGGVKKTPVANVEGVDCSAKYAVGIDTVFKGFVGMVKLQFNQDTPLLATDEVGNKSVFMPLYN